MEYAITKQWHVLVFYHLLSPPSAVNIISIIMELPNQLSVPALKVSQNLVLVSGVLQDMKDSEMLEPVSPGVPPLAFGAGGPM